MGKREARDIVKEFARKIAERYMPTSEEEQEIARAQAVADAAEPGKWIVVGRWEPLD